MKLRRSNQYQPILIVAIAFINASLLAYVVIGGQQKSVAVNSGISNSLFNEEYRKHAISTTNMTFIDPPPFVYDVGTKKWGGVDLKRKVEEKIDLSECPLCKSAEMDRRAEKGNRYVGNSTPRDLIITSMLKYSYNLEAFVRTLRSTGCKARVVIFYDDLSLGTITPYIHDLLKKCGVIAIEVGYLKKPYEKKVYEVRHLWFYRFLHDYRKYFDRIIVSDLSDAFFQSDPFTSEFTNETFQVTTELVELQKCPLNGLWIKKADPNYDPTFYQGRISLCFGLLYGSTNAMMIFYDTIFNMKEWKEFKLSTIDQGYLNYYFYRGIFEKRGLHITATLPNDLIISARGGTASNEVDKVTGYSKMKGTKVIPAMIHHYNRHCKFLNDVKKVCPSLNTNKKYSFSKAKETTC